MVKAAVRNRAAVLTDILPTAHALETHAAGDGPIQHHTVAGLKLRNSIARTDDFPGTLVSQHNAAVPMQRVPIGMANTVALTAIITSLAPGSSIPIVCTEKAPSPSVTRHGPRSSLSSERYVKKTIQLAAEPESLEYTTGLSAEATKPPTSTPGHQRAMSFT